MSLTLQEIINSRRDIELLDMKVAMTTAQKAAEVCNVPVKAIAKTIILKCESQEYVALIMSGQERMDESKVRAQLNCKKIRFASPEEALKVTGYPTGGTPPIGLGKNLRVLMDRGLLDLEYIIGGGGTPETLVKLSPQTLVEVSQASVGDFAKR